LGTPRGASWGPDDTIIFATSDQRGGGLLSVPAGGGTPKALTTLDAAKFEAGHFFPFFLPGGRAVLFTIASLRQADDVQVAVLDLKTGQRKTLVRGASSAQYVDAGYLVYAASGSLRAVRFDLGRLQVVGDPVPVVDQVMNAGTGEVNFAVSRGGTLVYVPASAALQAVPPRSLVWVNRQGREEAVNTPPRAYAVARLSPDGTRVALDVRDQENDIWIWDLVRRGLTRLTVDPAIDLSPVWTPDGRRIIWTSTRAGGNPNLYSQAADGTGIIERLTADQYAQFPTSISFDGTQVAFFQPTTGTRVEIATLMMESPPTRLASGSSTALGGGPSTALGAGPSTTLGAGERRTELLIQSAAAKYGGEISPDGRWIAYASNESGQFEIYVRPFPKVEGGRWQVSTAGGTRPAWARSGREIFYLDENELLTGVPVQTTGTTFTAGNPARILSTRYYAGSTTRGFDHRWYDVSPEGQRFLKIKDLPPSQQPSTSTPASMVVVLNWLEELKQRVPTR
jgi:hypothetical protein